MITTAEIEQIKEYLSGTMFPIGTIIIFASPDPPEGFLVCDGAMVQKNDYPQLYNLIGTIFGEDGDLFQLPDLRGRFVRGFDPQNIRDSDHGFGEPQDDAFQGHSHKTDWKEKTVERSGSHCHSLYGDKRFLKIGSDVSGGILSSLYKDFTTGNMTSDDGEHTHTLPDIILGDVCSNKYGRVKVATETRPKNISLNFCIKAK
jgi:hypothetical protein